MSIKPRLLIIGVGNLLAQDDAIGLLLADMVSKLLKSNQNIEVELVGEKIFNIIPAICSQEENTKVLIIDSANIEVDCILVKVTSDLQDLHYMKTSHGISLLQTLQIAMNLCPRETYVLLVRSESTELGEMCVHPSTAERGVKCLIKALKTVFKGAEINYDEIEEKLRNEIKSYLCSSS